MGAVYLGVDVETGQEVALKTVLVAQANELAAIRTEIQALRRLAHPAIVRIIDTGIEALYPAAGNSNVTPVSPSLTSHNRRAVSGSAARRVMPTVSSRWE